MFVEPSPLKMMRIFQGNAVQMVTWAVQELPPFRGGLLLVPVCSILLFASSRAGLHLQMQGSSVLQGKRSPDHMVLLQSVLGPSEGSHKDTPTGGAADVSCRSLGHEEGSPSQQVPRGRWTFHCSDFRQLPLAANRA